MSKPVDVNALYDRLKTINEPPLESEFEAILENKTKITPLFLEELKQFSEDYKSIGRLGDDYIRHTVAIFLLAHFKEKKAYPLLITLLSRYGDPIIKLTGEVFTEALPRILASVCNGELKPIYSVIENPRINPWIRAAALDSLMVLWKEDQLGRDDLVLYLKRLMETTLERQPSYIWDAIALIAYDIHPEELADLLRQAIDDKLIESIVLNHRSLASSLMEDRLSIIKNKKHVVDGFIKSPIIELTWWLYPNDEALDKGMEYASVAVPLADKKVIPGERSAPIGWRADTVVHGAKK